MQIRTMIFSFCDPRPVFSGLLAARSEAATNALRLPVRGKTYGVKPIVVKRSNMLASPLRSRALMQTMEAVCAAALMLLSALPEHWLSAERSLQTQNQGDPQQLNRPLHAPRMRISWPLHSPISTHWVGRSLTSSRDDPTRN